MKGVQYDPQHEGMTQLLLVAVDQSSPMVTAAKKMVKELLQAPPEGVPSMLVSMDREANSGMHGAIGKVSMGALETKNRESPQRREAMGPKTSALSSKCPRCGRRPSPSCCPSKSAKQQQDPNPQTPKPKSSTPKVWKAALTQLLPDHEKEDWEPSSIVLLMLFDLRQALPSISRDDAWRKVSVFRHPLNPDP